MSNPVFSNSDVFGEPRRTGRGGAATAARPAQYGAYGAQAADAASLQNMYEAPSATPVDTQRLTYTDVIMKTGGLLALLVVVAAATWSIAPELWIGGMIVGLVLGLVNAFKKNPSPVLITLYAAAQGVFLGGISKFYESWQDGVVLQAVLATLSVFAVALFLYSSGKVRVTPKFTRFLLIGMVGYLVFSLVNVVLVWTGVLEGWGMRGGTMGIVVGIIAVVLASMSLIMDFDFIKRGVEQGVPAKFAWSAAFGLIVTLVWLYLELLRLLAIFNSGD
ncbi:MULTISPECIES: Bax inhibitor-1/YccA family protein [unclassified Isoptericola]|uniref:Bax inhibitor-1/YccA family protein n=1 Tax=unclassified Isoptericola TaxID=2623355 RepID=UPI0027137481|nr:MULTISPECIES: Bax inhibitor-1/YccA family protein [unclassified Isoptericola]MDO8144046.1 Bax inhibitor-1/YccA family protein [Isoptericola sp. 178]MDO8152409.1 Bax inhibitor-1/YccA family protein [Isoptericola sp. b408]